MFWTWVPQCTVNRDTLCFFHYRHLIVQDEGQVDAREL